MNAHQYAEDFVGFLNEAMTGFHAVDASKKRLKSAGFHQISEFDEWELQPEGKYFFVRNDTTVIAFTIGNHISNDTLGYTVLGAHTDSPCLKVKPVTCVTKGNALMINVQPYGGGLWHTWFDRDLGLAGRVIVRTEDESITTKLFSITEPIARIPNLAIHLTSGSERESFAPNLHEHGKALLSINPNFLETKATSEEEHVTGRIHPALLRLVAEAAGVSSKDIVDVEMQLIDLQPATIGGACKELIFGGRLDNLCSSYQSLSALIESSTHPLEHVSNVKVCMLFDHEEIGSASAQGAASSIFMDTIQRIHSKLIAPYTSESLMRALRRSFIVSADMAHALHPNYPQKHDASMAPALNKGLVIKHNANQRYATNAISASVFRKLATKAKEPIGMQEFTVRADASCGSTVGPILATLTGILTVDCGTPQLSMHSIREMMGTEDVRTGVLHFTSVLDHHPSMAKDLDSTRLNEWNLEMSATEGPALASITPRGKESIGSDLTEVFERCLQTKTSSDLHLERALPGVYYIDNVLTEEECNALVQQIDTSDSLTFWCKEKKEDQATRAYRNADTLEMQSAFFATELWRRIESALQSNMPPVVISDDPDDESYERDLVGEWKACGTNPLTLFVKYPCHGSFAPHTDGRAILDFNLRSHYSIILFLNSVPQECGAGTRFYAAEAVQKLQLTKHNIYSSSITTDPAKSNPSVDTSAQHWTSSPELVQGEIAAQAGRMVIFHQAWVHEGVPPIPPYQKYIIRSDVMFQRTSPICDTEPDREAYRLFRDAEWLAESGQTEEAIKLFKRAFRLSPTLAQIMGQA